MTHALSQEQKQSLYDDGYVVLKNAVSQELVDAAIDRIRNPEEGVYVGGTKQLTDLVNASTVTPILHEAMGYFDPPIVCHMWDEWEGMGDVVRANQAGVSSI